MKNIIRTLMVMSAIFLFFRDSYADKDRSLGSHNTNSGSVNKVKAEGCSPATGCMDLDLNNVRARINTGGDMWWDLQNVSEYYIPKNTKKTSMFSGSLWIGGVDVNGQLKLAALRYRQVGNDYWPGPLTTDGTAAVDVATCKKYDKHFKITRNEVNEFLSHCDPVDGHFVGATGYSIPASISEWPAHGDVSKGQPYYLAPFYDNIKDGGDYNPYEGDYPYYDIDNSLCPLGLPPGTAPEGTPEQFTAPGGILSDEVLKGDQTLWWVFNDKGNSHTETQGQAIGLEIRAQAFCFATNDEINNMTFYSYEIINRSTYTLTQTYFSQWVDTDLGYPKDDFVGCDVKRGLGYCYNGKAIDGNGEASSYGAQPPAVGVDFFQGPYMDPDGIDNPAGLCDVGINGVNFGNSRIDDERFGMRRFVFHNNDETVQGDPKIAPEYYNYLRGIWRDGTSMVWGGNAHVSNAGACGPECAFMFPGDSDPCYWGTGGVPPNCLPYWTEETANNVPADRRFMQSAGPFTLKPGAVNYITVGIPWARAVSGGPFASVELMRQVDDKCQKLFDNCFKVVDGPDAPELTIQELDRELILYLTNDTIISNNKRERYQEYDPNIVSPAGSVGSARYDSTYNFEGYQIFQLKDATVSIADIHDPDKARLVAQCDIKNFDKDGNPIGNLVNYYFDETTGANSPVLEVQGTNTGIIHSFRILSDEFATGDRRLINHKQYYYIAIAYAYNNYLKYSQEPGNQIPGVSGLDGQKKPYLSGRKSPTGLIKSVTAIPHNPSPEANGTIMHAAYGDGPKITRIEGQGNGGMTLDLTTVTVDKILSGSTDRTLEYENNRGPIDVRVIDPLNVKSGNFTLKFINVPNYTSYTSLYKAKWVLVNEDDHKVYSSDTTLEIGDEKILLDLGLSVTIKQVEKGGDSLNPNYGFIESTIQYADSSQQWLGGVPDVDGGFGFSFNWERSGTMCDNQDATNNDYDLVLSNGNCTGKEWDPNKYYTNILGGTFAPYRLSSHYENGPAYPSYFGLNKLENICSIDLVICPNDPSKWTRCPVIEECENTNTSLSEGNAKKFSLRKGQSMMKNGNSYFDLTPDPAGGTGMSWFPGYVINVETGERLNMMFGEDSWLIGENGRDMKWNPTANLVTNLYNMSFANNQILFGGKHYLYILCHHGDSPDDCPAYDEGAWLYSQLSTGADPNKKNVYSDVIWTGIPMAKYNVPWLANDVKIRVRVMKPYAKSYSSLGDSATVEIKNKNLPMYSFNTKDIATEYGNNETAKSALDMINIVPNPYYAYSGYETSQLDNRVKITNLPEKCTISIYTVNGTLIRQFTKDETKTSYDWDLKNYAGIPISGGIYLIHIKADGIGEKVIKWFGVLRPIDLNAF